MVIRYKIKTPTEKTYRDVYDRLRAKHVQIFVESEKRRMLSTGNIPSNVLTDIRHRGATVSVDPQYALESRKRA